jgi:hypothetical protein
MRCAAASQKDLTQVQCLEDRTLLTVLLFEDFEDAAVTYTTNFPDDILGLEFGGGFYGRVFSDSAFPAGLNYVNDQGDSFYAAQDTDHFFVESPTDVVQLDWTGIDISGETGLELSLFAAESDDGDIERWDPDSSVTIEAQLDSGGYFPIFAIESDVLVGGDDTPRIDTDLDGIGDGTEITNTFTQFSTPIPPGSTLDLRLTISNLDGFGEDIAIDNVLLTSFDPVPPTVAVNIVDGSLTDSDNSSQVTFNFSTDVLGFDASDVTTSGGTLSNFAAPAVPLTPQPLPPTMASTRPARSALRPVTSTALERSAEQIPTR